MSRIKIAILREFLATTTNHWAIFPAILLYAGTIHVSGPAALGWIVLGFLPSLMFISREVFQSFLLQLLTFPIFAAILLLLPIEPYDLRTAMLFLGIIYVVLSVFKTVKQDRQGTTAFPPFIPVLINLALSMIAVYTIKVPISFLMHVSAIMAMLLSLLTFYVDRYFIFTIANEETASNMPKRKIFHSGMSATSWYLGIVAAITLFIASFSISDDFFRTIVHYINMGIRAIVKFFKRFFPDNQESTDIPEDGQLNRLGLPDVPEGKLSIFWKILEVVVLALVALILITFIVNLIIRIVKWFMARDPKRRVIEAEEECESIDLHESITEKRPRAEVEEEDDPFLSPTQRIRRLYRRKALASGKEPYALRRITARELGEDQNLPGMAEIYEKARYSTQDCTKEDLKAMQLACRRKKSES